MARYIDADELIAHLHSQAEGRPIAFVTMTQLTSSISFVEKISAADVAPKSEVELYMRLYHEVEDELASTYDKLDKAKAEVAREIFEEIEKLVALKMPAKITPIFKRDLDYSHGVIDGQRDAVFGILVLLTELKKKYTEDNG